VACAPGFDSRPAVFFGPTGLNLLLTYPAQEDKISGENQPEYKKSLSRKEITK
jgi:hypothetical protein